MERLSRAGRKDAIVDAIKRLEAKGKYFAFTQGEICKKMGVTSQSKIRDILWEMVEEGRLVGGSTAIPGYNHELSIFARAAGEQLEMPASYGTYINGQWVEMSGEALGYA